MSGLNNKTTFITLFLVVATELIGFGLIIPILPQIASRFQSNAFLLGFLLASYSIAQFISAPILGHLSDKYGRKKILAISKFGTVCAYIVFAFSNTYILILVSRLIDGFTGGNIAVARAYVADVTSVENRSKGMAILGISFGTGFILGPAIGGFVYSDSGGHMTAALIAGGMSFLALLFTIFLLKEPERKKNKTSKGIVRWGKIPSKPVGIILMSVAVYMTLFSSFETTFSVFTDQTFGFSERDNSFVFTFIGILALIIQGYISRKKTTAFKPLVTIGLVIMAVSFACLSQSSTVWLMLIAVSAMALGFGLVNCFMPALLTTHCDEENRGSIMGVYESVSSLSRLFGPLMVYSLFYTSLPTGYAIFACLLVAVGAFFYVSYKDMV